MLKNINLTLVYEAIVLIIHLLKGLRYCDHYPKNMIKFKLFFGIAIANQIKSQEFRYLLASQVT